MIRSANTSDIAIITSIYNEVIAEGGFTGDTVPVSLQSREAWFEAHQDRYAVFVMEDLGLSSWTAQTPLIKVRNL